MHQGSHKCCVLQLFTRCDDITSRPVSLTVIAILLNESDWKEMTEAEAVFPVGPYTRNVRFTLCPETPFSFIRPIKLLVMGPTCNGGVRGRQPFSLSGNTCQCH